MVNLCHIKRGQPYKNPKKGNRRAPFNTGMKVIGSARTLFWLEKSSILGSNSRLLEMNRVYSTRARLDPKSGVCCTSKIMQYTKLVFNFISAFRLSFIFEQRDNSKTSYLTTLIHKIKFCYTSMLASSILLLHCASVVEHAINLFESLIKDYYIYYAYNSLWFNSRISSKMIKFNII